MKSLILLVLLAATASWVQANTIKPWSYNIKASKGQIAHGNLPQKVIRARNSCFNKAQIGELLAMKKMDGIPLNHVLKNIVDWNSRAHNNKRLPWFLVLEMQRLARDAYREKYSSPHDVDNFVVALYNSCLTSGRLGIDSAYIQVTMTLK